MPRFKLIAMTTPVPGKEAEFLDWYQNTHLVQMVQFPGSKGAQLYKQTVKMMGADNNQYLAIYDIETDNPGEFLAAVGQASASGALTSSDASDKSVAYTALFVENGDRVEP